VLSEEERERYSRQIMLEEIGIAGQEKLQGGKVLIIGAGGLGSPAALYLAAAGVGTIGLADSDVVDLSNLNRQILHGTPDRGTGKVPSAQKRLSALNPHTQVVAYPFMITAENITEIIENYDFILDATDNFDAKFLINDTCVRGKKAFSHGGVLRFRGQTITVLPHASPCYRCIFPESPPEDVALSCSRDGILGVVPGVIGSIQATETIKYLTGAGDLLTGRLLTFDALAMRFREVGISRNPSCPVCAGGSER
jgi:molybdopterin/thiamine biosynthesis adenylyltransferase